MKKVQPFMHRVRGKGRPQMVLIGNGLERSCPPTRLDPKGRKKQLFFIQTKAVNFGARHILLISIRTESSKACPVPATALITP